MCLCIPLARNNVENILVMVRMEIVWANFQTEPENIPIYLCPWVTPYHFFYIPLFAWLGAALTALAVCRFAVISHQNVNNKEIVSRWEQIKFIVMCTRYSFVQISMEMIFVHRANAWVCLFFGLLLLLLMHELWISVEWLFFSIIV